MFGLLDGREDPANRQQVMAEVLRRRQQQEAMQEANQQANKFSTLAAIAQMANNPGAANAAKMAHLSAQKQYSPMSLGQQGFALPNSGEFVPSPIYEDERNAVRTQQRELQQERQDAIRERERSRQEAAYAAQQDRLEAARERALVAQQFRMTLAQMNDTRARDLAADKIGAKKDAANAKLQAAEEAKQKGREGVSENLAEMANVYLKLDAAGAAVNSIKGNVFTNALNRAAASKPGQLFGQTLGTKEQSLRDRLAQMRPLLITDIMQATGLKSSQLNSDRELMFYIEATTDPGRDIHANLAALNHLDRKFGTGKGVVKVDPAYEVKLNQEFQTRLQASPPQTPPPGLVLPPGAKYIGPAQ